MVVPALAAAGMAFLSFGAVLHAQEQTQDRQQASQVASRIANILRSDRSSIDIRSVAAALPDDRVIIRRPGRPVIDTGPPANSAQRNFELSAMGTFPGGSVTVLDYSQTNANTPYWLIAVAALPIGLVVACAVGAASWLSAALRKEIDRASAAAERVAAGDFSARMGEMSQSEFRVLARAFDGMATRLDTADRNQRQFLGDLAHEIATPITAVTSSALALADGTASTEEERLDAAHGLTEETLRLQVLLDDLRRMTRLDIAEATSFDTTDLEELCRGIAARFSPLARTAGVQLTLESGRAMVRSDPRLIEMVVGNFVSNAIRYTPRGGTVRIATRRQRHEAMVTVSDSGIGIAPEHQERIFDRFYRVDDARQRATGGSGLGLAIAARAANELHGRIDVESEPAVGSIFRLVLPTS
jgi:signal transduction histidine kinase